MDIWFVSNFFAIVNNVWDPVSSSLRYKPSFRIRRSYDNSINKFLRNYHPIFHSGCTILHSHQQCATVPIYPHSRQQLFILLNNSHADWCEAVPHCGSHLFLRRCYGMQKIV